MAKRTSAPPQPQHAELSLSKINQGITLIERRIKEIEAFDIEKIDRRWHPDVEALETAVDHALAATFGAGTIEYNRYSVAQRFDSGSITIGGGETPVRLVHQYLREGIGRSLALLRQALVELQERKEFLQPEDAPAPAVRRDPRKVFVVHGHDEEAKAVVARYLDRIALQPVILHEMPNKGRTIIAKFQEEASDVGFAVVLVTLDDVGGKTGGPQRPRARQNVILELGFFLGKLGPGHVVALVRGDVETPSDFDGVLFVTMDPGGGWKLLLARELQTAGVQFDPAKAFSA